MLFGSSDSYRQSRENIALQAYRIDRTAIVYEEASGTEGSISLSSVTIRK
jgi:hypothetical protein